MRVVRIRQLPWVRRHPFGSWTPPPQRFVQLAARHSNARSPVVRTGRGVAGDAPSRSSWSTIIPMMAAWQTPALCIEPYDPEVPVGLAHRFAVADLQARHASVTLDRHDLAIHGEDFLGSFAFRLPHGGDGRQTLEGLLKGGGLVGRLGCEQLGEHLGARRSPSSLVQRNPRLHPSTVHPATLSPVRSRRPGNASDLLHAMNGTVAHCGRYGRRAALPAVCWAPWLTATNRPVAAARRPRPASVCSMVSWPSLPSPGLRPGPRRSSQCWNGESASGR